MEQVTELTGHVGIIYSLQVLDSPSPGGARLFSACYDKTLRVRQNMTQECDSAVCTAQDMKHILQL